MNNPVSPNLGSHCPPDSPASATSGSSNQAGNAMGRRPESDSTNSAKQQASAKQQVDSAKRQATELTGKAKEELRQATNQAKSKGQEYAANKKRQFSGEIGVFSDAIRSAAETLHQEKHDSVACYADAAAEQLDRLRDTIESKSSRELVRDARRLIHRRPEVVYGGLFVAGLAVMRFLKASASHDLDARGQSKSRTEGFRYEEEQDWRELPSRTSSQPIPRPYSPATSSADPAAPDDKRGPVGNSGTSSDVGIDLETTTYEQTKGASNER